MSPKAEERAPEDDIKRIPAREACSEARELRTDFGELPACLTPFLDERSGLRSLRDLEL
jgi:hypothetical protein